MRFRERYSRTSVRPLPHFSASNPAKLRLKHQIETEITYVCDVRRGGKDAAQIYFFPEVLSLPGADVSLAEVFSLLELSLLPSALLSGAEDVEEAADPLPFEELPPDDFLA